MLKRRELLKMGAVVGGTGLPAGKAAGATDPTLRGKRHAS